MKHLFTFFLCLAGIVSMSAQSLSLFDTDASGFPTIKAKFWASDAAGRQIRPSKGDLICRENGELRTITDVTCPTPKVPVAISSVLTVDVSGSMSSGSGSTANIDLAKAAARAWIQGLPAGQSECALTSFDDKNYLHQDFTTDRTKLLRGLETLSPNGGTNYNAGLLTPLAGSLEISKRARYKRVIVFLTDGLPNFEPNTASIIAEAKKQGCMVFAVTLGMECPPSLRTLSIQSGGQWFENVTTTTEATAVYTRILQLAQNDEPCEITWESKVTCEADYVNVAIQWQGVTASSGYQQPSDASTSLAVQPLFVAFGGKAPTTQVDKTITLTSINNECTVTGIIRKNGSPDFSVVNGSFPLIIPKKSSRTITLRFTPGDSAMRYAGFDVITDKCTTGFSCSGGYRTKKNTNPTIKLTHPNGGEVFVAGSDTVITWTGVAPSDNVILEYSHDGGLSWNTIAEAANNLRYPWKRIPKPASDRCLARVRQSRFTKISTPGTLQFDLLGHTSTVTNARWSPDGTKVVTTSSDMTASVWSAYSGTVLITLKGHFERIFDACWSPDGMRIATASQDHTVRIWSAETGEQLFRMEGHTGWVSTIDWSPDGMKIVSAGSDKTAIIWSATNGTILHRLTNHTDYVNEVRWSPDAGKVVTAGYDSTAIIWDAASGLALHTLHGHSSSVTTARWSPDGMKLATGSYDKSFKIWDVPSGTVLHTLIGNINIGANSAVYSLQWKPDGSQIITSSDDYLSRIWDVSSGTILFTLPGYSSNPTIENGWSPDGTLLLTSGCSDVITSYPENAILIWDSFTGRLLHKLQGHTRYLTGVSWSPDGSQIVSSSDDETAKIWILDAAPIQEDTSDNLFRIVIPQVSAGSIDMKQCLIGAVKDSLIPAFVLNTGQYPCRIDSIFFTGNDAGSFAVVSGNPIYELGAGAGKRTEFRFIPNRIGRHSAGITIISQSDTLQTSIEGEGIVPAVTILSSAIDFGEVLLGSKKDTIQAVTIKNNRGVPLTITSTRHAGPNDVDFTTLSGGGNFILQPYDTARLDLEFFPKSEGRTSGQLLFDYNELGSPARVQLFGEGVPLSTSIKAQDITAQAGEKVTLSLKLLTSTGMQVLGAPTDWYARIHYNKSILFNEQTNNVCAGTTDSCVLELTGVYNPKTDELIALPCITTLGATDHSTIVIDTFYWTNSVIATEVVTENGIVQITGVCADGGVRLFIPAQNSTSLATRPNPAQDNLQIQYGLREPLTVTLELLTMTGQVVQTILTNQSQLAGQYALTSDVSLLGNGVYLLRMTTSKETLTSRVDIVK